ncbi:hypothetical protein HJC10_40940 [Corallococcus exiguus]|uniref:hypothetical protein n=1 Tax=Corallococcus TaxID=83461 RepID=UPI000ECA1A71|nr:MULTISPECIES: hypothetical protein [Corallococcus]NNB90637.1 hypothetical protein [Corallococcus exiguus]NNC09175.1 hypothetical protein [Corallococcus exiguus]NPC53209.1 hypothetical protein [Corallococcus exiguus]RKH74871.1 hypothetical protein D7X99_40140 [Corallococcus sp. AB032C]
MSGEGTKPVAAVLVGLTNFRLGRILLWTTTVFLGLLALVPGPDSGTLWRMAAIPGVLALIGTGTAWWKNRQSSRSGPIPWLMFRLVLGAVLFSAAALLMWWRRRRELKADAPVPPPSAEQVDRWATAELDLAAVERSS